MTHIVALAHDADLRRTAVPQMWPMTLFHSGNICGATTSFVRATLHSNEHLTSTT